MTKKHDAEDDYKAYTMEGSLEKRVRDWARYADFRHVATSPCPKCGKGMYQFQPEDETGFCVNCYKSSNPEAKHKKGWHGLGANAHKKQKGKNLIEGSKEEEK
jgi:hypothetical protein